MRREIDDQPYLLAVSVNMMRDQTRSYTRDILTYETCDATHREPVHDDRIKDPNIDTQLKCICSHNAEEIS